LIARQALAEIGSDLLLANLGSSEQSDPTKANVRDRACRLGPARSWVAEAIGCRWPRGRTNAIVRDPRKLGGPPEMPG
jgi:hypothetical protein